MSTGLGREDIRALLDDLSAELAARGARAARRVGSMVKFHDWIVSGGNRLVLLGDALAGARRRDGHLHGRG